MTLRIVDRPASPPVPQAKAPERNPGFPLDLDWVGRVRMNRSALERRAATIGTRRTVKKDWQVAWLLKAITLMDLTTLNSDDTPGRVERLCAKARHPVRQDILDGLGVGDLRIQPAAVCVYHSFVKTAVDALKGTGINVAAVSTAFPHGLAPLSTRLAEIKVTEFLARLPLFSDLEPGELERMASGTQALHPAKGEVVFHQGDPCNGFHCIVYGRIKLAFTASNGAEKVVEIIGPGQSFGEALMFMDKAYIVTAQAVADSMLLHVSKPAVMAELERSPAFARRMLAGAATVRFCTGGSRSSSHRYKAVRTL